jgi:hypothetical protein
MSPRAFNIQQRLDRSSAGGILDIPHPAVLRYREPKQLIDDFAASWGVAPEAVALPLTAPDGLLFRVEGLSDAISPYAVVSPELKDFQDIVYAFASMGLGVYLTLDPTLPFIRTGALHIIDIVGDSSASLCISNPRSQDIAGAILGTGVDLALTATTEAKGKVKGVVLDVVGLWPMGANQERLELTCFCPSCEKYFNTTQPGLLKHFRTFPNPWNLLLRDSGTGISYVDDVRMRSSEDDVVGLSRQKGFHEVFEDKSNANLRVQAQLLLDYIRVRHEQTVAAVQQVFTQALREVAGVSRVLITEGVYYGWTGGLLLERLDVASSAGRPYDEIWFDPSSTDLVLQHLPFRSYMWQRSRYFIDAFWDFASSAADPVRRATTSIARLSEERAKEIIRSRLAKAIGTAMTGRTSLVALPNLRTEGDESQRAGFIGVALSREVGERFIEAIRISEGLQEKQAAERGDLSELLQQMLAASKKQPK